jgi:peptidoglycan lytic transglycosylase G
MKAERFVPAAAALVFAVMLVAVGWFLYRTPGTLVHGTPPHQVSNYQPGTLVVVHVGDGDSASKIGTALQDAGVIQSGRQFRVLASLMGVVDKLAPGDYEFEKGITAVDTVQRISQGITGSQVVTIREGLRSEEIGELLENDGIVSAADFRKALSDQYSEPFLARLGGNTLEGVLFPATYGFSRNMSGHAVVDRLLTAFQLRYESDISAKLSTGPGALTLQQVVTLASIVEREAQVPTERAIIASVFLNRLNAGIALQADPTVQYAVGNDPSSVGRYGYWKTELSLNDLAIDSPYNTYVNVGLPPGPISNPGLDSILAVLTPADTNYLYFVARTDGSHAFAATLAEHQKNVCQIDPTRSEC